jgi:hypothetical protein
MSTQEERERLELLQGTLDLLILRTLIFGPQHGQGIARAIQDTSEKELLVEHGDALSSPPAPGRALLDFREMGRFVQQPQRAFLFVNENWPPATGQRNNQMESSGQGDRADFGL